MACRRDHRNRFIGCNVGPARIRGCERSCCPYPDSEKEPNERWNYLRHGTEFHIASLWYPAHIPRTIAPSQHHACRNHYRPKYVCVPCRRVFKPAIIEGNQYDLWDIRTGWWWSPLPDRIPHVWAEYKRICRLPARKEEKRKLEEVEYEVFRGYTEGKAYTKEEKDRFKATNPQLWWEPMTTSRCPGCGAEGLAVGGTFRAPPVKDARAWQRVAGMLEAGEVFSYCLTKEEEAEHIKDAQLERKKREGKDTWMVEKQRRIFLLTGRGDDPQSIAAG